MLVSTQQAVFAYKLLTENAEFRFKFKFMIIQQANIEHLGGILQLQEKYHVGNLTEQEKQEKGFVTMKVTPEQFTYLIEKRGVFIALLDGKVGAYALTSPWDFYRQWPIINVMEEILPTLKLENLDITIENSFQYGPVCIDESCRGQNILQGLFDAILPVYANDFEFAVTFINNVNERSFRAHARQTPLSIIGHFGFNGNHYSALACRC